MNHPHHSFGYTLHDKVPQMDRAERKRRFGGYEVHEGEFWDHDFHSRWWRVRIHVLMLNIDEAIASRRERYEAVRAM